MIILKTIIALVVPPMLGFARQPEPEISEPVMEPLEFLKETPPDWSIRKRPASHYKPKPRRDPEIDLMVFLASISREQRDRLERKWRAGIFRNGYSSGALAMA